MSSGYKLKVLLCGPPGVGKEDLVKRFIKTKFQTDYKLTVGVDILTKDVELDNDNICTLSIWDIGGQERFSFIRSTFYKGAAGAILVFDLSRAVTWEQIKEWREEVKQFAGNIPIVLVGNKFDMLKDAGEAIDRDECREYAESQGAVFIETSVKNNANIENLFVSLTKLIVG